MNIARALDQLAEAGFWRVALAGDGEQTLAQATSDGDIALVLGFGWLAGLITFDAIVSPNGTGNIYLSATSRVISRY